LAFGVGFTHNLEQAYGFLVEHYRPGDRICLIGFSRGAFTARAVAGMIHMCGVLRPTHAALIPYVSRIYQGAKFGAAGKVKSTYAWRPGDAEVEHWGAHDHPAVDFLGVWDTVASIGVFCKRKTLPYTTENPSVIETRQALAIDERRAYFQPKLCTSRDGKRVRQVWFPGVHADVGGGYRGQERGLARTSLMWMLQELLPGIDPVAGEYPAELVKIDGEAYRREVMNDAEEPPWFDPEAERHRSLRGAWWAIEALPMNYAVYTREWFIPGAHPRTPWPGDAIHSSAVERAAATSYELREDCEAANFPRSRGRAGCRRRLTLSESRRSRLPAQRCRFEKTDSRLNRRGFQRPSS